MDIKRIYKENFSLYFPEVAARTVVGGDEDFEVNYYREDVVKELLKTIDHLRTGSCWCEAGIGNPMFGGRHTAVCIKTQELMKKWRDVYEYDEEGKENEGLE